MRAALDLDGARFEVVLRRDGDRIVARVGDQEIPVRVARNGRGAAVTAGGHVFLIGPADGRSVAIDGRHVAMRIQALAGVAGADGRSHTVHGPVHAPMNGRLVDIPVAAGARVAAGDVLFVLEAMKMRNEVRSPGDGVVAKLHRRTGDTVDPSVAVLELAPDEAPTPRETS